jgi:DNA-binding transcriptional LysR family regulator
MQLYEDARRLLSDADAVRERIQRLPQGPEGSVTVAAPFLLASLLLGPVLAGLRQSHPRIRVFVLDDLSLMVRKAMLDRRADVGILVDTPRLENLRCTPLARESIFVCGHDADGTVAKLLRGKADGGYPEIDFAQAAQLPLVLQSRRFSIRQTVEEAATRLGLGLNVVHEHDSARVIRSLYQCGAGFTFTPACSLAESAHPERSHWVVARVARPQLQRAYTLATPADRMPDAATQVVVDALVQETRRLVLAGRWQAELQI